MLLLVPAIPRDRPWPPITTCIVLLTSLIFLVLWPIEVFKESTVSRPVYEEKARQLARMALDPSAGLDANERAILEADKDKTPYPPPSTLDVFQRITNNSMALVGESKYRWSQEYPLFQSMQRSITLKPKASTPYQIFGYRPSGGWFPGIITHQFLHAGWLHIIGNMLFLWAAGLVLEERLGNSYLVLYLVGGCVAAICQAAWGLPGAEIMVGASGSIATLMGFALFAMPTARVPLFYMYWLGVMPRMGTFPSPLWFCLPLWIAQQVFFLFAPLHGELANVGYAAHVGGFAFGALVGTVYRFFPW